MRKPLFWKLFGTYVLIVLILSVLVLVFSFARIRSHYEDTLAGELESLGRVLNVGVRPRLEGGGLAGLDAFVKEMGREIHARVTVIDLEGKVVADSDVDPATMENHRYRPEVSEALEGRVGRSRRYSHTVERNMLYVGLPIESSGRILGVLRLSYFLEAIDVLLGRLRTTIVRIVLLGALVALGLALFVSVSIARPIGLLTRAAGAMAEGRFETRVALGHRDEFRLLGDAFNGMAGRLQQLFKEVTSRRDELDGLIASLREGLIVTDRDGRIILVNEMFKKIIGVAAPEGKRAWETLRNPRLRDFLGRAAVSNDPVTGEIEIGAETYFCTAAAMKDGRGTLLTLYDVSSIRRAEVMKRDFVVNASHELRTPLAAIQGAVETLEDGVGEGTKPVVAILKRQAERLRNIVEDLLDLAAAEDRSVPLDLADVDLRALAEKALESFARRMEEKGIKASLSAPADLPLIQADPNLIDQVLVNLIDNAVKYTDAGRVDVSVSAAGGEVRLSVRDTGIGIGDEQLDRVFERFYVVDKSRSRKSGGTGLGLSIVKHIAERHSGRVQVESAVGRGSTFTVILPVRQPADLHGRTPAGSPLRAVGEAGEGEK